MIDFACSVHGVQKSNCSLSVSEKGPVDDEQRSKKFNDTSFAAFFSLRLPLSLSILLMYQSFPDCGFPLIPYQSSFCTNLATERREN